VYSSRAHAFVAVVPEVTHKDTGDICDGKTYQMRLWTRAECLTHLMMNGIDSMWIVSHAQPQHCIKMPREWLRGSAVQVFGGKSSCCARKHIGTLQHCDRELLVQPLLGLYGKLYAQAKYLRESERKARGTSDSQNGDAHKSRVKAPARAVSGSEVCAECTPEDEPSTMAIKSTCRKVEFAHGVQQLKAHPAARRYSQEGAFHSKDSRLSEVSLDQLQRGVSPDGNGIDGASSAPSASPTHSTGPRYMKTYELVSRLEADIFPRTFLYQTETGEVETELFGDLIPLMKAIIDEDPVLRKQLYSQQVKIRARRKLFDERERTETRRARRRSSVGTSAVGPRDRRRRLSLPSNSLAVPTRLCGGAEAGTHVEQATKPRGRRGSAGDVLDLAHARPRSVQLRQGSPFSTELFEQSRAQLPAGALQKCISLSAERITATTLQQSSAAGGGVVAPTRLSSAMRHRLSFSESSLGRVRKMSATELFKAEQKQSAQLLLRRRWSFSGNYACVRAGENHEADMPGELEILTGVGLADRMTVANTIADARRHAMWLDGEREYAVQSQRTTISQAQRKREWSRKKWKGASSLVRLSQTVSGGAESGSLGEQSLMSRAGWRMYSRYSRGSFFDRNSSSGEADMGEGGASLFAILSEPSCVDMNRISNARHQWQQTAEHVCAELRRSSQGAAHGRRSTWKAGNSFRGPACNSTDDFTRNATPASAVPAATDGVRGGFDRGNRRSVLSAFTSSAALRSPPPASSTQKPPSLASMSRSTSAAPALSLDAAPDDTRSPPSQMHGASGTRAARQVLTLPHCEPKESKTGPGGGEWWGFRT